MKKSFWKFLHRHKKKTHIKSKPIIIILVIIVLVAIIIFFPSIEFSEYENEEHGIRISYPKNWEVSTMASFAPVYFDSPFENDYDLFSENVFVNSADLSENLTGLEDFKETRIEFIKQLDEQYGEVDVNIIEQAPTTLADNSAYEIVYTVRDEKNNERFKILEIWAIKNRIVYMVVYTAEEDKYLNYLYVVQKMINSFEILN